MYEVIKRCSHPKEEHRLGLYEKGDEGKKLQDNGEIFVIKSS
jgi:hypothetical protein